LIQKGGGSSRPLGSKLPLSCRTVKEDGDKKAKPIGEESFSSKLVFEKNDYFRYIDRIVDPNRRE
jgi:hypothetical protein